MRREIRVDGRRRIRYSELQGAGVESAIILGVRRKTDSSTAGLPGCRNFIVPDIDFVLSISFSLSSPLSPSRYPPEAIREKKKGKPGGVGKDTKSYCRENRGG